MQRPILTLVFALFLLNTQAQYFDVGVKLGTTNYIGDLTDQRVSNHGYHGAFGLYGRYNISSRFSVAASILKGKISGDDQVNPNRALRMRNLSFRSDITEFELRGEVNLAKFNLRADQVSTPYLFSGLTYFRFSPEASHLGQYTPLQPLGTEGQSLNGSGYRLDQVAIPLGVGFKFGLGYRATLGFEAGLRMTFTDYLDDAGGVYPDLPILLKENPVAAQLSYRSPELDPAMDYNPVGEARADASNHDRYFFVGVSMAVNLTDKYGLDFDKKYEIWKNTEAERAAAAAAAAQLKAYRKTIREENRAARTVRREARSGEREARRHETDPVKAARQQLRTEHLAARQAARTERKNARNDRRTARQQETEQKTSVTKAEREQARAERVAATAQRKARKAHLKEAWKQGRAVKRAKAEAAYAISPEGKRRAAEQKRKADMKQKRHDLREEKRATRRAARERMRQLRRHGKELREGV